MEWDKVDTLDFIAIYKKYEIIWNPTHPDHFNKVRKQDAWEEVAKQVDRSVEECKKKMDYLLAALRREKMKMTKSMGTGKGTNEVYKSSWFAFESMKFVWDKNKPKTKLSTLPVTDNCEMIEDDETEHLEENSEECITTADTGPGLSTQNADTRVNPKVAAKRLQPTAPTSSFQKKKRQTSNDERLDKAFEILTSATPLDDSQHFGNLVASKLRQYDDHIRCSIQCDILKIFNRANRDAYSTASNFPLYVTNNPYTSQASSSSHSSLSSCSRHQTPLQSPNLSHRNLSQIQTHSQSEDSQQPLSATDTFAQDWEVQNQALLENSTEHFIQELGNFVQK